MQYSYTSKGYLEPHNSHPFQLQSQILTKLKYFPNIGEPHERKRLIRRTKAGQEAARARGRTGGRPKGLSPPLSRNCSDGDKCLQRLKKYSRHYEGIFNSFDNNDL